MAIYAEMFDVALARRLAAGAPLDADDESRLAVLRKFRAAEVKLLKEQDEAFVAETLGGAWGRDFAALRASEIEQLEGSRDADTMMAMGILGAVAGIATGYGTGQVADISPSTNLMMASAGQRDRLSAALATSMAEVRAGAGGRTVEIMGEDLTLRSGGVEDLRTQLKPIYRRRFPETV